MKILLAVGRLFTILKAKWNLVAKSVEEAKLKQAGILTGSFFKKEKKKAPSTLQKHWIYRELTKLQRENKIAASTIWGGGAYFWNSLYFLAICFENTSAKKKKKFFKLNEKNKNIQKDCTRTYSSLFSFYVGRVYFKMTTQSGPVKAIDRNIFYLSHLKLPIEI